MTGNERRKTILKLATLNGNVSTRAMAQHFKVSRMTINRDLRQLEKAGVIKAIHGGAIPLITRLQDNEQQFCSSCDKPTLPHQHFQLRHPDLSIETYCCAYCGLTAQLQNKSAEYHSVTDMISGRTLPVKDAYFLIRSSASPCCHPSILSFADESEVITFRSAFGGVIARIDATLDFLRTEHNLKLSR
ncbi:MAG TPA: DeoR family transcriptional regulator [Geopsychrobacteraceae bacterium]|nr:DeoR family transcriptional regulator [Geopsychrobacteraceae bacterium]